jgi:hypothetical protein
MNSFSEEFLTDLEMFTQSSAPLIKTLQTWTPRKGAPPERHLALGLAQGLPLEAISYQLQQNEFFDKIGTTLQIHVSTAGLKEIQGAPLLETKEQVWLFGLRWFNKYYEYLLDAATLKTEFYRRDHVRFLQLLKKLLDPHPGRRISFREALHVWYPLSAVLKTESQTEDDAASDGDDRPPASQPVAKSGGPLPLPQPSPPAQIPQSAPTHSTNAVVVSVGESHPPQATAGGRRRLVLVGFGDPAARSKTRKNRGS